MTTVTLKNEIDLRKEGWKRCSGGLYLGERKSDAPYYVSHAYQQFFAGQKAKLINIDYNIYSRSQAGPKLLVQRGKMQQWVPWLVVKGNLPDLTRTDFSQYIIEKKFGIRGRAAYNKISKRFEFNCALDKMDRTTARKVANWVLDVLENEKGKK